MKEPKFIKQYKRKVKKMIPYNYPKRRRILSSISEMLSGYMDEFPEAEYEDLIAEHGTPEELAASLFGILSEENILYLCNKKGKMSLILPSIIIFAVLLFSAIRESTYRNNAQNSNIYIEEKMTITRYVTSENIYESTEHEDVHEKLPKTIEGKVDMQLSLLYGLFQN